MNKTLVLFTDYFPYGKTETFLETEIIYLAKAFEKVIICPRKYADTIRTMPVNIEISDALYQSKPKGKIQLYLLGFLFMLYKLPSLLKLGLFRNTSNTGFFKAIKYMGLISNSRAKTKRFLNQREFNFNTTIFYTYWLGYETLALGLYKIINQNLKVVSRAHRYDLYNHTSEKALTFIKPLNLQLVDKVYCISQNGLDYLTSKYPIAKEKLVLSYLGTNNPGFTVQPMDNNSFKIVSCSGIRPVKRLDKIIDVLSHLSKQDFSLKIEWHHLGDGPLKDDIKLLAKEKLTVKIDYFFYGNVNNKEIFKYYQRIQPNLFINLSDSEGLPVSIMEAMSVGIPVLATDVGGTSEIVNTETGWLVSKNEDEINIGEIIKKIFELKSYISKRENAFARWKSEFDAHINYSEFVNQITML